MALQETWAGIKRMGTEPRKTPSGSDWDLDKGVSLGKFKTYFRISSNTQGVMHLGKDNQSYLKGW